MGPLTCQERCFQFHKILKLNVKTERRVKMQKLASLSKENDSKFADKYKSKESGPKKTFLMGQSGRSSKWSVMDESGRSFELKGTVQFYT